MSWTDAEYRLIKFQAAHRYDAFANPDKVGLGQCACGEDMYYCDHAPHFARALIAELGLAAIAVGGPLAVMWRDNRYRT